MSVVDKQEKIEVESKDEQSGLSEFGFDAEFTEFDGYTTISGKETRDISNCTGYYVSDLEISNTVNGYPEVTIFNNDEKDEKGEYVKNYQSIRIRLIDHDEYVDLYANIPRRNDKGFINGLNKFQNFFRGGFDLIISFMRWIDEYSIVDSNGDEVNKINMVNVEKICKKIDSFEYVKIKIVKGSSEEYPSFIILDMKNL